MPLRTILTVRTTYFSLVVFTFSRSLHSSIPHLSSRWNWKRRLVVGGHALVSRCPGHCTIQPYKVKSALQCTVWSQCTPVSHRQTDKHHGNSVTIRSTNASRAKNMLLLGRVALVRGAAAYSHQTFPWTICRSVRRSVQCIVEKRRIRSRCRLAS